MSEPHVHKTMRYHTVSHGLYEDPLTGDLEHKVEDIAEPPLDCAACVERNEALLVSARESEGLRAYMDCGVKDTQAVCAFNGICRVHLLAAFSAEHKAKLKAEADLAALRKRLEGAEGALRQLQWSEHRMGVDTCPACTAQKGAGHRSWCWLWAALADAGTVENAHPAEPSTAEMISDFTQGALHGEMPKPKKEAPPSPYCEKPLGCPHTYGCGEPRGHPGAHRCGCGWTEAT